MRKILPVVLATLLASISFAQAPFTKIRADQVKVTSNGMAYAVYPSLQLDLQALDTNLFQLGLIAISPTELTNLVNTLVNNSVYDLLSSYTNLTDPAVVPAIFPTGSVLNVHGLLASNVVAASVTSTNPIVVGGSKVYGAVDSTAACVTVPTNTVTSFPTNFWRFPVSPAQSFQTAACIASNGVLLIQTAGVYTVSFSGKVFPPEGTSNWVPRVETSLACGLVMTNPCLVFPDADTNLSLFATFSYPLSAGDTITPVASFDPVLVDGTNVVSGGVLFASVSILVDTNGAPVTSIPDGRW